MNTYITFTFQFYGRHSIGGDIKLVLLDLIVTGSISTVQKQESSSPYEKAEFNKSINTPFYLRTLYLFTSLSAALAYTPTKLLYKFCKDNKSAFVRDYVDQARYLCHRTNKARKEGKPVQMEFEAIENQLLRGGAKLHFTPWERQ